MLLAGAAYKYYLRKKAEAEEPAQLHPEQGLETRFDGGLLVLRDFSLVGDLNFGVGHPLMDQAYAAHPLAKERYIPIAAFHRFLFEEKVNELVTLLASLGATRVQVSAHKGYRSAGGISFGASVPGKSGSAEANCKESSQSSALFEEHFRPTSPPAVPDRLVWFGHEASWQALAERRLKFNTSSFRAELSYEDSFGVDGKLKLGLDGIGLKLGGNFTEFEETVWKFEGEFA